TAQQLQGKELSYNNIADADAAWECAKSFDTPACVIVKHANPCGVALGADAADAYSRAFRTDPTSAFGGIIAFNRPVDGEAARAVSTQFVWVVSRPPYTDESKQVFSAKATWRGLEIPLDEVRPDGATDWERGRNAQAVKRVGSGLLIQSADNRDMTLA